MIMPLETVASAGDGPTIAAAQDSRWLQVEPGSGSPGTLVSVTGGGFAPGEQLRLALGAITLTHDSLSADEAGALRATFTVPGHALGGAQIVSVLRAEPASELQAARIGGSQALFTVTDAPTPASTTALAPLGALSPPLLPGMPLSPSTVVEKVAVTPQPAKAWTLAIYMTADGDQNKDATDDLDELLAVTNASAAANVHVVVLVDRTDQPTTYLWWRGGTTTALVNVTPDALANTNVDTGNPQAFVDFMGFVRQNFPGNRYAVSLWSHGSGWEGLQHNPQSNSFWDMAELRDALSRGLQQLGKPRLDLLLFDACYMGGFEVLTEIRETADVVVAAPGKMPAEGLRYDALLAELGQTSRTPAQIATAVVQSVRTTYSTTTDYAVSAYLMGTPFDSLSATIDRAALELLRLAARQGGDIIKTARVSSTSYQERFIDIGDFARNIRDSQNLNATAVRNAANEVIAALTPGGGFVLAEAHSPANRPSYSLTAYFPADDGRGRSTGLREIEPTVALDSRYSQLRAQNSGWFRLLTALATGQFPSLPPPSETPGGEVPPPAAAAANHDVIFAQVLNPLHVNLFRTSSQGDEVPLALLDDGYINFYPRWSPTGRQVVYISDRGVPRVGGFSVGRNLFLINSDGSFPSSGPTQLTNVGVNCPNGPFRGTTCTIQQVAHPAWLSDGSGLLYTLYSFEYATFQVTARSTIRVVSPDGTQNIELLPALAGANSIAQYIRFDTADLRAQGGTPQYLIFGYSVPEEYANQFNANFRVNNIGFFDLTNRNGGGVNVDLNDLYGFFLHSSTDYNNGNGNWLYAGFPAWRPNSNELAFLYNRVGTPRILYSPTRLDYRAPLPAGVPDRLNPFYPFLGPATYPTFDIGRMRLEVLSPSQGYFGYTMTYPYWQFANSSVGVGANFRPSWKPDGSNNLAVSVSVNVGAAWDVAVIASDSDSDTSEDTLRPLTQNGLSVTPGWGMVRAEDVRQRLVVAPPYLAPGPTAAYILTGSGFAAGERVTIKVNGQAIGQVTADGRGRFEVRIGLPEAAPGRLQFTAEGSAAAAGVGSSAARISNTSEMVVLSDGGLFIPLIVR